MHICSELIEDTSKLFINEDPITPTPIKPIHLLVSDAFIL